MTNYSSLFEWKGYVSGFASFFLSLMLYYSYSLDFSYSLVGAAFTGALVWGSYLVIRMMILAARE